MGLVATVAPYSTSAAVAADEPCIGADCDVVADPDGAEYVGTGGLLLPPDSFTGSSDDRSTAATCDGCRWALLPMCRTGDGAGVNCGPAATSCPPGEFRRIVLLLRPDATDWEEIGLVCLAPTDPLTIEDVGAELSDVVVEEVPELEPVTSNRAAERWSSCQRSSRLDSRQVLGRREFSLVGFDIVLQGRANWTWDFGDGAHGDDRAMLEGHGPMSGDSHLRVGGQIPGRGDNRVARPGSPLTVWDPSRSVARQWSQVGDPLTLVVSEARAELIAG